MKADIPGRGVRVDLHGLQLNITTLISVQNHEQHYGIEHMAVETDDYGGTLAQLRRNGVRIAGAYGIVHARGGLTGTPVAMAEALSAIAQPGITSVTDLFASALAVHSRQDRAEWIGDHDLPGLAEPVGVFVLTR